jgi:hypothetical protein
MVLPTNRGEFLQRKEALSLLLNTCGSQTALLTTACGPEEREAQRTKDRFSSPLRCA